MDYRKEYIQIIKKAQTQNRKKGSGIYYELHHILPRSLFSLWKERKTNMVLLTGQEHFDCHKLLAKIYGGKMWLAYWRLAYDGRSGRKLTAKEYEELRIENSKACKERNYILFKDEKERKKRGSPKEKNGMFGKQHSQKTKELISKKNKGRKNPHTNEQNIKIKEAVKKAFANTDPKILSARALKIWESRYKNDPQLKEKSEKRKNKIINLKRGGGWNKEIPHSEELKKKISAALSKKVMCIETGIIYNSCKEASVKTGLWNISHAARSGTKTKGFHFKYID